MNKRLEILVKALGWPHIFAEQPGGRWRVAAFACYALLTGFGAVMHDFWADEAENWQLTQFMNLGYLLAYLDRLGHPPLWYVLSKGVASAGLPFAALAALNWLIMLGVAWLWLWRAPFAPWVKLGWLFSFALAFQYAVVVRGYGLFVLLMLAVANAYGARAHKPLRYGVLLALWLNTEAFALVPGLVLGVLLLGEVRRSRAWQGWAAVGVVGLAVVVVLSVLWPDVSGIQTSVTRYFAKLPENSSRMLLHLYQGFWSQTLFRYVAHIGVVSQLSWLCAAGGAIYVVLVGQHALRARMMAVYAGWLGWYVFILCRLYHGQYWHSLLLPAFCFWQLWLNRQAGERSQPHRAAAWLLALMLLAGVYSMVQAHKRQVIYGYSASAAMAEYLREQGLDSTLVSTACFGVSALQLRLPEVAFWMSGLNEVGVYGAWSGAKFACGISMNLLTLPVLQAAMEEPLLIVSTDALVPPPGMELRLLYSARGMIDSYYLYRLRVR